MNKVYAVYHYYYDRDAERYGEFPCKEDLICCFTSLKKAEEFKQKYECPRKTNDGDQGTLVIEELPTTYDEKDFWWLPKKKENTEPIKHIKSDDFKKSQKSIFLCFLNLLKMN